MEAFETKFAVFVEYLSKLKTELQVSDLESIKTAMISAKFDQVCVFPKKKKLNGYNMFLKSRMAELQDKEPDSNKRMKQVSEEWGKLTETVKEEWKKKAKEASPPLDQSQVKIKKTRKPQPISGYQVFVRETMESLKEIPPRERMKEIGKRWKALKPEEQQAYKTKAGGEKPKK
jgi:hypothetical protein|uniref:HMG box domain-containing protein n=1 Tax=viral metagenome TaxID=1070528 RepID=A0A6C0BKK1_9ZZZZ